MSNHIKVKKTHKLKVVSHGTIACMSVFYHWKFELYFKYWDLKYRRQRVIQLFFHFYLILKLDVTSSSCNSSMIFFLVCYSGIQIVIFIDFSYSGDPKTTGAWMLNCRKMVDSQMFWILFGRPKNITFWLA